MKSLTGLTGEEFEDLSKRFSDTYIQVESAKSNRKRKFGGGDKGVLETFSDKLFFILLYLKTYPTFDVIGFFYNRDRSRPCRWVRKYLPILEKTLGYSCVLPERRIDSIEEFMKKFPEIKDIFIDGTEREIQRPKNPKNQKKNYSGKKKKHTRKNIVVCDEKKKILYLSPTKSGRIHDKKALEKTNFLLHIPPDVTVWQDSGFQGTQNIHKKTMMPKKNTKKKKLTEKEKEENKTISGLRIVVENAICGIKRFNAVASPLRNKKGIDDMMMNVCSGLWNFHLQ